MAAVVTSSIPQTTLNGGIDGNEYICNLYIAFVLNTHNKLLLQQTSLFRDLNLLLFESSIHFISLGIS